MSIQESGEMYLESIYVLSQNNAKVRAIDISEYMGFSKPSVSRAMNLLKEGGYITVSEDGSIKLTDEGLILAQCTYEKHNIISDFFIKIGVDKEIAVDDACRIEHCISDTSFNALKRHLDSL